MKPNILSTEQIGSKQIMLKLNLPPTLLWFKGHFPIQPILPGVAQLEWVMLFAREHLAASLQLQTIKNIKFQQPLLPEDDVFLTIKLDEEKNLLEFSYQRPRGDELQQISSGKIALWL